MQMGENSSVTINGLRFFGGNANGIDYAGAGGGILNSGTLTLSNCSFSANNAKEAAGAILNNFGALTITNTLFHNNQSTGTTNSDGGAINSLGGSLTATGCTFTDNVATEGGAVYADGTDGAVTSTFTNCTFRSNSALGGFGGGAIYTNGEAGDAGIGQASMTLNNCTLNSNNTDNSGGAILNDGGTQGLSTLTLQQLHSEQQRSQRGRRFEELHRWQRC